jgi:branched-chain amino acid transport system ATP-binding protein
MSEVLLKVDGLSKSFGGLRAVSEVSFSVHDGDIYGVIGPNGAGKSTLFNAIAGVIRPSSGRVYYQGRDVSTLGAFRKCRLGIGRTFQSSQSFAHHTVEENLQAAAYGPASSIKSWIRSRLTNEEARQVESVLELTGLFQLRGKYPADLNNLELQKLSIGMALVNQPKLLLLDEPSGGLIEAEVSLLKEFLRSLKAKGITLVLIDHKMSLVMDICNDITVIAAGKYVASGNPASLLSNPLVREVYLGHN